MGSSKLIFELLALEVPLKDRFLRPAFKLSPVGLKGRVGEEGAIISGFQLVVNSDNG